MVLEINGGYWFDPTVGMFQITRAIASQIVLRETTEASFQEVNGSNSLTARSILVFAPTLGTLCYRMNEQKFGLRIDESLF